MRRDYHGSRRYESDEVAIGRTSLEFAWFVAGAKHWLGRMWRWVARPTGSEVLLRDGERHFSELGAATRSDVPQANNWRVLP